MALPLNERKRLAVDAAITDLGVKTLETMKQKLRDNAVMKLVKDKAGLTVTDRYVRERFAAAQEELSSERS